MAKTQRVGNLFIIDVSPLRKLASGLRKVSPDLSNQLRAGLRKGGDLVRDDAKARVEGSQEIPNNIGPSIRTRVYGVRVSVVAGSAAATAAAAFEHEGFPGTFRHPLFGNRNYWYDQRAHPYLRPAAEFNAPKVAELVLDEATVVIDQVLAEATGS